MPARRAALGSILGAGAMLAAPRIAKAADDADLFAAIERVKALLQAQETACSRLSALNKRLPKRSSLPALLARRDDGALFRTTKAESETLDWSDVDAARSMLRMFRTLRIDETNALFSSYLTRVAEIDAAEKEFSHLWRATKASLGYDEVEEAYNQAVSVAYDAAKALLDVRPATAAGLCAVVECLLEAEVFEEDDEGMALARLLLESSVLGGEKA